MGALENVFTVRGEKSEYHPAWIIFFFISTQSCVTILNMFLWKSEPMKAMVLRSLESCDPAWALKFLLCRTKSHETEDLGAGLTRKWVQALILALLCFVTLVKPLASLSLSFLICKMR